jgi:hypothetical protein
MSPRLLSILAILLTASATGAQPAPPLDQRPLLNQMPRGLRAARPGPTAFTRPIHEPFAEPVTAAKIRRAIDDAVMYLRSRQTPDGGVEEGYRAGGGTALAALAWLAAGADPASDQQLKSALDYLAKLDVDDTYVRAIRANVWEYALRKVPYDDRVRALLKTDFEWLLAALGSKEGWRYQRASTDWDNSCTQYGVLGIWAAARAGFDPGEKFWPTMSRHFRSCQNADGGWGYTANSGSTANMATAGLASMFLVFDMHHGKTAYSAANPRTFTSGEPAEVLQSLERGMNWLGKVQGSKEDGYYLYGIERTGVASGRKLIGGEDWFGRGALAVLRAQQFDGSIPLGQWGGPAIGTSFCTLFLVYGGAPVAIAKLQYGAGHDWNLNPRDLANLSKELWSVYERPLNWQTVSIAEPPERYDAPLLWITGSQPARFTEEEMLRLREYVQRGGTIVAEPSDRSPQFAAALEELVRQMFPARDFPGYGLQPLPPEHAIYTVVKQDWQRLPRLRGVSDGARTFFILSDEYLSGDWQTNRTDSDAFRLATNLLFYATDLGTLEGKYASILPDTAAAKVRETPITVARVKHGAAAAHPRDWDAAAMSWRVFAPYVRHITGCELKEAGPVALDRDTLDGIRVLHVTGRDELRLSAAERAALKQFVAKGGTVLVDAYAGSPKFAVAARRELEATFGKLERLPADHLLAEGRFQGGVDLTRAEFKLSVRQLLRSRSEQPRGQQLLVALAGKRPAVIFSEFDLAGAMAGIENYRALSYKPDSARQVVGNLLAYLAAD